MIPSLAPVKVRATRDGAHNAFNGFLGISIWRDVPCFAAVLAQERYEFALRWRFLIVVGALIGAPLAWFVHPFAGAVGFLLSALLTKVPAFNRYLELHGHAIECAVAAEHYGMNLDDYERKEAADMSVSYDGLFKSMGEDGIVAALKGLRSFAADWAESHDDLILKDMERI